MISQPHGDPAFHPAALHNNHLFVQRRRKRRLENFTKILCQGFQSVAGKYFQTHVLPRLSQCVLEDISIHILEELEKFFSMKNPFDFDKLFDDIF
jgi:hypothetical protein